MSHKYSVKKKIAPFSATLGGGGAQRVMASLANGFYRAGYAVDMVLVQRVGGYLDELDDGVRVVDLASSRTLFSIFPLIRYLRRARPDVLLATQGHVNIIAVIARMLACKSTRICVRESNNVSANVRNTGGWKASVSQRFIRVAYSAANKVIAPSQGVADDLVKSFGILENHIVVIPNPIDIERIQALAKEPLAELLWAEKSLPIVLGVGSLTAQKEFTTLIKAFSEAVRSADAKLIILGEGEERESLYALVKSLGLNESVSFPGFVQNPFAYMKQAVMYVLSSRFEGLPNTLLQALAVGTPVVATDCPSGPREILEGGRWGRLVPVGDVDAMAQAIIDGLEGRIKKPPFGLMEDRYGMIGITQKYLDVLLGHTGRSL